MTEYQCWFCGQGIARDDASAVMVTIEGLWAAGSQSEDNPLQALYAHSTCAKDRLQGATMAFEPCIFGEDD